MFTPAILLSFAASALAFSVTSPSNSSGWTTSGPNTVAWTTVSTDASNFSIILSNQGTPPAYTEVLAPLVYGSEGSVTVNPPSGGWKTGTGYRVNLVKDSTDLSSIYAQSDDFTIASSSSSTFSSSSASSSSASSTGSVSVTSSGSSSTSASASHASHSSASGSVTDSSASSSSTAAASSASSSSAAAAGMGVQTGLIGLLALLGVALA